MSSYWVRVIYREPESNRMVVKEFQRAVIADFDVVKKTLTVREGTHDVFLSFAPGDCILISLEKDSVANTLPGSSWDNLREKCYKLWQSNKKIEAIKTCREVSGYGLKEAKEWVENLAATYGDDESNQSNNNDDIPF